MEDVYANELEEVKRIIASIDTSGLRTKVSKEKTMPGRMLFDPKALNRTFRIAFTEQGWLKHREYCIYPVDYYTSDYSPPSSIKRAYREMDYVKNRVGVEVQFGKYAFMVYNVAAKMTIFHNLGIIDVGIEIVPVKELTPSRKSGHD